MSDLIDRQAAIRWVKTECNPYGKPTLDFESGKKVIEHLKQMPPAQPEPQEGHWILYDKRFPWRFHYKCSECGNYLDFSGVNGGRGEANFCPNCGVKMKGEQDGH